MANDDGCLWHLPSPGYRDLYDDCPAHFRGWRLSYLFNGRLDLLIFVQTLCGLGLGVYIGVKFTHLAPKALLQFALVLVPVLSGIIMLTFGR